MKDNKGSYIMGLIIAYIIGVALIVAVALLAWKGISILWNITT